MKATPLIRNVLAISIVAIMLHHEGLRAQTQFVLLNKIDLERGDLVKLVMKDSSHFYGIVLRKPLPDRILFQTRNGELEIPYRDIDYIVDHRFNYVLKANLKNAVLAGDAEIEKYRLRDLLLNQKSESSGIFYTNWHDAFRGSRYIIGDTNHVIISTNWGEVYFFHSELTPVDADTASDYLAEKSPVDLSQTVSAETEEIAPKDPLASQGFITPNGIAFGKGNFFFSDYFIGGLQLNYGPFDWLSLNMGGLYLPVSPSITVGTGGLKLTPLATDKWNISVGAQGLYSQVLKTTHLVLGYGSVSYGNWESQLSLFGGYTINHTDSLGYTNTKNDELLIIQAFKKVGTHIKLGVEFFFISNFDIVPLLISVRYFTDKFTLDAGGIFSLYKTGAVETTQTISEYLFGSHFYSLFVPVISFSYHF